MTGVYRTQDGKEYSVEKTERIEKCDFCGKLGEIEGEDGFIDGDLPGITGETFKGDRGDICRDCLVNGVSEEQLNKVIGDKQEINEEMREHRKESVEL